MIDSRHPTELEIFQALEGTLNQTALADVERHLKKCWNCRLRSAEMQDGILAFAKYYETGLLANLPSPPAGWSRWPAIFERGRENCELPLQTRIKAFWKALWTPFFRQLAASSGIALCFVFLILWWLGNTTPIEAKEFLNRSRNDSLFNPAAPAGFKQRIRIRVVRANQKTEVIGQRVLWSRESRLNANIDLSVLQRTQFQSNSLLDARQFANWHDHLTDARDHVSSHDGLITMSTTSRIDIVRAGALSVRASDWHPIAESITLDDGWTMHLQELSWEPLKPTDQASVPRTPSRPARQRNIEALLAHRELRVWEILRGLDADTTEGAYVISTNDKQLQVNATLPTKDRRDQIERQLRESMPLSVNWHVDPQAQNEEADSNHKLPPLLLDELGLPFANTEQRETFVRLVLRHSNDLHTAAVALVRFSERFPCTRERLLPAADRRRVMAIAAAYRSAMQEHALQLENNLRQKGLMLDSEAGSHNAGWQGNALLCFRLTSDLVRLLHQPYNAQDVNTSSRIQLATIRDRLIQLNTDLNDFEIGPSELRTSK